MPNLNENSQNGFRRPASGQPRPMLRGEIVDEFGKGECVITRIDHRGFTENVEFTAGENGITAGNFIATAKNRDGDETDQPMERMLEYRYSIIPDKGCSMEYLKVSIMAVDLEPSQISFVLSWRGDGSAKICAPDEGSASGSDCDLVHRELHQNEVITLGTIHEKSPEWQVEVPTHSLSISIWINGSSAEENASSISVITDAVFLQKDKIPNPINPRIPQPGTGRIQPKEVLDLIDEVERVLEPTGTIKRQSDCARFDENIAGEKNSGSKNTLIGDDPNFEPYSSPPSNIEAVLCEKIKLYRGEDIILSTYGLFADKIEADATYVSASLPEWIFLDQRSGDLMGTVPTRSNDTTETKFSIYAVDGAGNSAKAIIPVEYLVEDFTTDSDIRDYQFSEGDAVSIATVGMFIDFGLDVAGLEFTGTGLPDGLVVDPGDGLIKGNLAYGSAADAPYNVIIIASDGENTGSGISMQFLLDVTENEKNLASGLIDESSRVADEISMQQMSLIDKNCPIDMDDFEAPMVQLFTPDHCIYLQVNAGLGTYNSNCNYDVRLAGREELPDWIACSPEGLISICCSPENRYVDLELIQTDEDGSELSFDIGVDTFAGKMTPAHRPRETPTEKQIRQLSAA